MRKSNLKSLALSALSAFALAVVGVGGTFALFTDKAETEIEVGSGIVKVTSQIGNLTLSSIAADNTISSTDPAYAGEVTSGLGAGKYRYDEVATNVTQGNFTNGGLAKIEGSTLKLNRLTPGDKVAFTLGINNSSDISIRYRLKIVGSGSPALLQGLTAKINGEATSILRRYSDWHFLEANGEIADLPMELELPLDKDNAYQGLNCDITIGIEAVQGNASVAYAEYATLYEVTAQAEAPITTNVASSGQARLDSVTKLEDTSSLVSVTLPKNTFLADEDTQNLGLSITPNDEVNAGITIADNQQAQSYDISIVDLDTGEPAIDEDNMMQMTVSMFVGTDLGGLKIYHVHNNVSTEIPNISYNSTTGIVTFTTTNFSEYVAVHNRAITVPLENGDITVLVPTEYAENCVPQTVVAGQDTVLTSGPITITVPADAAKTKNSLILRLAELTKDEAKAAKTFKNTSISGGYGQKYYRVSIDGLSAENTVPLHYDINYSGANQILDVYLNKTLKPAVSNENGHYQFDALDLGSVEYKLNYVASESHQIQNSLQGINATARIPENAWLTVPENEVRLEVSAASKPSGIVLDARQGSISFNVALPGVGKNSSTTAIEVAIDLTGYEIEGTEAPVLYRDTTPAAHISETDLVSYDPSEHSLCFRDSFSTFQSDSNQKVYTLVYNLLTPAEQALIAQINAGDNGDTYNIAGDMMIDLASIAGPLSGKENITLSGQEDTRALSQDAKFTNQGLTVQDMDIVSTKGLSVSGDGTTVKNGSIVPGTNWGVENYNLVTDASGKSVLNLTGSNNTLENLDVAKFGQTSGSDGSINITSDTVDSVTTVKNLSLHPWETQSMIDFVNDYLGTEFASLQEFYPHASEYSFTGTRLKSMFANSAGLHMGSFKGRLNIEDSSIRMPLDSLYVGLNSGDNFGARISLERSTFDSPSMGFNRIQSLKADHCTFKNDWNDGAITIRLTETRNMNREGGTFGVSFTNCEFSEKVNFDISLYGGSAHFPISFENCTYLGEAITEDNIQQIITVTGASATYAGTTVNA